MAKVIKLKRQAPSQGAAASADCGGCPACGKHDGYVNVGKSHYFVCHRHKTVWRGGWDLFPSWRAETEETWEENARFLREYRVVEPLRRPIRTDARHSFPVPVAVIAVIAPCCLFPAPTEV